MEKYCRTWQAQDDDVAHTLRICNAYCFFTVTTAERTRLSVLYTYIACLEVFISFSGLYKRNALPNNIIGTSLSQSIV
jgi:hypothetical protein